MSLQIVNDEEMFTRSECACEFCKTTHMMVDRDWPVFSKNPKTKLQKNMINVIERIEAREAKKKLKRLRK